MLTHPSKVHLVDIVKWLEQKSDSDRGTTLFLGARAGGLFRSRTLYSTSQYFSPRTFQNMSRVEQFAECYRVLNREDFSKSDIDTILIASLQGLEPSETDLSLSELVKVGIFDTIISTNIDDLLTRAFLKVGLKENHDFQVVIPQTGFIEDIVLLKLQISCRFIKAFGDLASGEYNLIRHDFYFDTHERLRTFLSSVLQNDVLMLGYDSYWDRSIDAIFPLEGQELWYVNEGQIEPSLMRQLQLRKGRYLAGGEGSYEQFIQTLHWHLMSEKTISGRLVMAKPTASPVSLTIPLSPPEEQISLNSPSQSGIVQDIPPILSHYEKEQRRRVFIVYSQKDKKYFNQLQTHLARYEREKLVDIWNDTKIAAGTNWHVEIQKTLAITRIAILLVSADFLASDFLTENILSPLLQSAATGGAIILPVMLNYCVIEDTPLQHFQPFNPPSEPVAAKRSSDRHKVWADLVRYMQTLVKDI